MTKRECEKIARANFKKHMESSMTSLTDAYKKPSKAKAEIWADCEADMRALGGCLLKVINYNTFHFTCGFIYPHPTTGHVMFAYYAPTWSAKVDMTPEV